MILYVCIVCVVNKVKIYKHGCMVILTAAEIRNDLQTIEVFKLKCIYKSILSFYTLFFNHFIMIVYWVKFSWASVSHAPATPVDKRASINWTAF